MDSVAESVKKKRFLWGVLLAWSPLVVFVTLCFNAFRDISSQKATGLGAVAGGLAEGFMMFGVIVTLVFQVTAIGLLLRGFARGHPLRALFSVLSICFCGLMLSVFAAFVWLMRLHR